MWCFASLTPHPRPSIVNFRQSRKKNSRNQTQTRARQSRNRLFVAEGSKARESEVVNNPRQKAREWSNRTMVNNNNQNGNGTIKG